MIHGKILPLLACLVALCAAPVYSQEEDAAPPLQTDRGIDYRSGGIGTEEREALFGATRDYPLKLVFAAKDKSDYLAEVAVGIADAGGKTVFEASGAGPYLFVKLGPGKYKVTATHDGVAKSTSVTVGSGKQTSAALYW